MYKYDGVCPSDIDAISNTIDKIIEDLKGILEGECLLETKLILNELLINAASHGNKSICQKCVKVKVKIIDNMIEIDVKDEGCGIKKPELKPVEELSTTGRGLFLVEHLSEELLINKNQIRVLKII